MKVSQIQYERYDIEKFKDAVVQFKSAASLATSAEEVLAAREVYLEEYVKFSTAYALSYCRFTLNTKDEFYASEMEYYDNVGPLATEACAEYCKVMLDSPFRNELEKKINPLSFKNYENTVRSYNPSVESECQRENALVTEYSKLMSELKVEFEGETLPLSVVRGYLADESRETRREAAFAIGKALEASSEKIEGIYDSLVKVRTEIARKLGFKDFVELGYLRMNRVDYDRGMVENFRKNVLEDLVPVVSEMKGHIAAELGLDRINFYDDSVYIKGGNPKPIGSAQQIFESAIKMYDEMHPEIGAFMHEMIENEAFDVEARDGKWGGGYCTSFDLYKQPFILANFNGSADDIDTITHEFGHAFAAKKEFECGDLELGVGGMETAECHSMSMEFFAEKYMNYFFDNPEDYRKSHLLSSISFIPYGVIVDEFQHIVYENPQMTPAERNEAYKNLENKYRPYMTFDGIPYLENGTRWQFQMHIFETPFYYIDYCLAQTVALGFLVAMTDDYDGALDRYIKFVSAGGTKRFSCLVKEAGLPDPFGKGTLAKLCLKLKAILDKYN